MDISLDQDEIWEQVLHQLLQLDLSAASLCRSACTARRFAKLANTVARKRCGVIGRQRIGSRAWSRVVSHSMGRLSCERTLDGMTDLCSVVDWVTCVCGLADGRVVSGSRVGPLKIWDVNTGECCQKLDLPGGYSGGLRQLSDGSVCCGAGCRIRVWDSSTAQRMREISGVQGSEWMTFGLVQELQGHTGDVIVTLSPSCGLLVSGSRDATLRVWDIESVGECTHALTGHTRDVNCLLQLSSSTIVSGSLDCTMRVWDCSSWACLRLLSGTSMISTIQSSANGGRIVSGRYDGALRVWCTQKWHCEYTIQGHTDRVQCMLRLHNGLFATGSGDGMIQIWDLDVGIAVQTLTRSGCDALAVIGGGVRSMVQLSDNRLASGTCNGTLRIWHLESGKCLQERKAHLLELQCIVQLDDGRVLTACNTHTIRVWA